MGLTKEIREGIVDFYRGLYLEAESWRPSLEGVDFNVLDSADASHLESQFLEEVIVALKQLSSEKALGPDKYTLGFFQHC